MLFQAFYQRGINLCGIEDNIQTTTASTNDPALPAVVWTNAPAGYSYSKCGFVGGPTTWSTLSGSGITLDVCGSQCVKRPSCQYFAVSETNNCTISLSFSDVRGPRKPLVYVDPTQTCGYVPNRGVAAPNSAVSQKATAEPSPSDAEVKAAKAKAAAEKAAKDKADADAKAAEAAPLNPSANAGYYSSSKCKFDERSLGSYRKSTRTVPSLDACASLCIGTSTCNYFTFAGGNCVRYTSSVVKPTQIADASLTCGSVTSRPNFNWVTKGILQTSSNCDFVVNDGSWKTSTIPSPTMTLADCRTYCTDTYKNNCNFFTLSPGLCTMSTSSSKPSAMPSSTTNNCGWIPSKY